MDTMELLDDVIAMVAGQVACEELIEGNVKPAAASLRAPYCSVVAEPILIV
jgi:hypothetical protein